MYFVIAALWLVCAIFNTITAAVQFSMEHKVLGALSTVLVFMNLALVVYYGGAGLEAL